LVTVRDQCWLQPSSTQQFYIEEQELSEKTVRDWSFAPEERGVSIILDVEHELYFTLVTDTLKVSSAMIWTTVVLVALAVSKLHTLIMDGFALGLEYFRRGKEKTKAYKRKTQVSVQGESSLWDWWNNEGAEGTCDGDSDDISSNPSTGYVEFEAASQTPLPNMSKLLPSCSPRSDLRMSFSQETYQLGVQEQHGSESGYVAPAVPGALKISSPTSGGRSKRTIL